MLAPSLFRFRFIIAFQVLLSVVFFIGNPVFSQSKIQKRTLQTLRIGQPINIDGDLTEDVWQQAEVSSDFSQVVPYSGKTPSQKTEVRILYDDNAVYVGAMLYDSAPDSIRKGLGVRDTGDDAIDADLFVVEFNPYNDDLQLFGFKVSSSNVQVDEKVNFDFWDNNWDAVWYSKTKINEKGWAVEMRIPFSALRIPNKEVQTWGLQMSRHIKRNSEWDSWNYLDESIRGYTQQVGTLVGISNIKPPIRLSISPYLSGYYDKASNQPKGDAYMRGGLDLKYGINKSYTLDMMLIPDFGQTPSDDHVLNLSTVETYYNEKRSFFTEGTELFSRADLFYSRRIGGEPVDKYKVYDNLLKDERVILNPNETQLANATKLSGRSSSGLATGFLNATSLTQHATAKDTITGQHRKMTSQLPTNYNILVVDQALKNNSYISLINTNVTYFDNSAQSANVIGTDMKFSNASGKYTLRVKGAYSQINKEAVKRGFYNEFDIGKTSGQFRYSLWTQVRSDKYDCRDLGYLDETNRINNSLRFQYNYYVPKSFFLNWYNTLTFANNYHYKPLGYSLFEIYFESSATLKNQMNVGFYCGGTPIPKYDFNEPRVQGWKYQEPTAGYVGANYTTDKKKQLWLFVNSWYWRASEYDRSTYYIDIRPTFKINGHFNISYEAIYERPLNSLGYISNNAIADTIYFGRRQSNNITNIIQGSYMFSSTSSLQLRGRYYWSGVKYKQFYILKEDGTMNSDTPFIPGKDVNDSSFNIDFTYTWQFAPGSELSIMWKNYITQSGSYVEPNYSENLKELWKNPHFNSISFKILYYLDYLYLRKKKSV